MVLLPEAVIFNRDVPPTSSKHPYVKQACLWGMSGIHIMAAAQASLGVWVQFQCLSGLCPVQGVLLKCRLYDLIPSSFSEPTVFNKDDFVLLGCSN